MRNEYPNIHQEIAIRKIQRAGAFIDNVEVAKGFCSVLFTVNDKVQQALVTTDGRVKFGGVDC